MQFTRFTDYALRVLIYVGQRPDEWVTIRQVSDAYSISRNHLMKVVSFLGGKGYLKSQRGPGGGVQLKIPPSEVLLANVIADAEGGFNLLDAPGRLPDNLQRPHEVLENILSGAAEEFLFSLNRHSLADVLETPPMPDNPPMVAHG